MKYLKLFESSNSWEIIDPSTFRKTSDINYSINQQTSDYISNSEWDFLFQLVLKLNIRGKSYVKGYQHGRSFLYDYIENGTHSNKILSNSWQNLINSTALRVYGPYGNSILEFIKSKDDYYFIDLSYELLNEKGQEKSFCESKLYCKCDQVTGIRDCLLDNCTFL